MSQHSIRSWAESQPLVITSGSSLNESFVVVIRKMSPNRALIRINHNVDFIKRGDRQRHLVRAHRRSCGDIGNFSCQGTAGLQAQTALGEICFEYSGKKISSKIDVAGCHWK